MFRSVDEAHTVYRTILAVAGGFYRSKSETLKEPSSWNSVDQRGFRDLLMRLEGAEETLGLTEVEANEGRLALGLPERGKILAVV